MPHTTPHYAQLDGLRALAALAVVLSHSTPWFNALDFGPAGVLLFFVLSGFLITGILLRARDDAEAAGQGVGGVLAAFYARRSLRIFPVYYAVVLIATFLALRGTGETLWANLTYTNNLYLAWRGEHVPGTVNHLWTLAVEEQFYLFWPLLVLCLPSRWLLPAVVAMVALGPLSRGLAASLETEEVASKVLTVCCLDSLGLGALLALIRHRAPDAPPSRWPTLALVVGVGVLATTFALAWSGQAVVLRRALKAGGFALVSLWLVASASRGFSGVVGRFLQSRPMVYLGSISYGIYLLHVFVPSVLAMAAGAIGMPFAWNQLSPGAKFAVMFGGTLPLAMLSWHWFEKPLNDLKRFFPYVNRESVVRRKSPAGESRPAVGDSVPTPAAV